MQNIPQWQIRKAIASDVPAIHRLICALAEYERAPEAVINTPAQLLETGFGPQPWYEAWVAEVETVARPVGFALVYRAYSTWRGRVLYLEDLYIEPEYRRLGLGEALFNTALAYARELKVGRFAWQVLEWNTPAIKFYEKMGATLDPEWINGKLENLGDLPAGT
jgi:GNAT superfamily N-acetyltransferase